MATKSFLFFAASISVAVALSVETQTASTQFLQPSSPEAVAQNPFETNDMTSISAMEAAAQNPSETGELTTISEMEAAITDLMLGKTALGATPMGGAIKKMQDLITNKMMPKVKTAHKADQNQLNKLVAEIKKCGSTKTSTLKKTQPTFATYKKESKFHKSCRSDEAVQFTSKKSCLSEQKSLYAFKKMKCEAYAAVSKQYGSTTNNRAIANKAGSETVESYITRLSETFCGKHVHGPKGTKSSTGGWGGGLVDGFLDRYLKAKGACETAVKEYQAKVKECKAKVHSYNVKKAKCNQYQTMMDAASCKNAVSVKDACEEYAECYTSKVRAYRIAENKVKIEETDRKAEWRGLQRMHCLISAFADGHVKHAEVDACRKQTVSTDYFTIAFPKVPVLSKCVVPSLYPATGAYKRAEFDPLPALAKGKAIAECSGLTEISLTPLSGSPKKCECSRVTLNGPYSAGPMVKCSNCIDVRTSSQKNSCPPGTKLFSPASRSDWRTFFSSATALYAPHFIIDVTRPQNGCGGCTHHAMNSGNRNQHSWRTSDGSPWWLRSTRYSEPNGDYNANCFLNLWHNPSNENAVTFNDGRCNYHSKSYYCQRERTDLKPKSGSPHSCKCSAVTTTGKYSAGSLIKCVNCLTVYKATQKNSCPAGMKIFSPRSREDWKTFIGSAGPLRAPHWIVDVTRPQNGCGGCTRYPMKSSDPHQVTWKTSDSSPWWLRSTRYNEPNGDYNANCYLDLWRTPSSDNNIQFNDGRCNYRSRSYYCQPIKTKPKPVPVPKKSAVLGFKVGLKWILAPKGVPCINACSKVGASCAEHKFPKSLAGYKEILKKIDHKAVTPPTYKYSGGLLTTPKHKAVKLNSELWPSDYCLDFDVTVPSKINSNAFGYEGTIAMLGKVDLVLAHTKKLMKGGSGTFGFMVIEQSNGGGPYFATKGLVKAGARQKGTFCYNEATNKASFIINGKPEGGYLFNPKSKYPTTRKDVYLTLLSGSHTGNHEMLQGGKLHAFSIRKASFKGCRSIQTGGWKYNPTLEPDGDCFWRGSGTNRCRGEKSKYSSSQRLFCPCQVATSWMRGNKGESCTAACKRTGMKCVENKWPKTGSEMSKILATTGTKCSSMHVGTWKFNPTFASSAKCYWKGSGTARCDGKHSGERRFCPCE